MTIQSKWKKKRQKNTKLIKLKYMLNKVTLENFSSDVEEIVNTFDVWEKKCISEMVNFNL